MSRRPEGLPEAKHLPQSQISVTSARPGTGASTLPPRAQTGAGGGSDYRSRAREPEPELFIARQAVVGPFRFRTRSSIAKEKVLQVLQKLRLSHFLDTFPGSAPTCETVMVRLVSFEAVQMLIQAARAQPLQTEHSGAPLWAIRCRSAEERARTGLVARAARILNDFREARGSPWRVEGHYKSNQESVWISRTSLATEKWLINKCPTTGTWSIDEGVFAWESAPRRRQPNG